jgi:hypothetical protein
MDLTLTSLPSPELHRVPTDPGTDWVKDEQIAIDAPPDDDPCPLPEANWRGDAPRTGVCGAVSPRVLMLPGGAFRMYYSQILPTPEFPSGANDYDHATTRILSAFSADGLTWRPEPGVRLSPQDGGAGAGRVVSSEVVPTGDGRYRMYYECCRGLQSEPSAILSAVSPDGLQFRREPGVRFEIAGRNLSSPRLVFFSNGACRLYCLDRGRGVISAASSDGLEFHQEPGVRVAQGDHYDALTAFASEIVQIDGAGYVMYYAGYAVKNRAYILRAESADGINWHKTTSPVISPGGRWDAAKCSEMCLYRLATGSDGRPRYRMVYEACDGTALNERGVWRIAAASDRRPTATNHAPPS